MHEATTIEGGASSPFQTGSFVSKAIPGGEAYSSLYSLLAGIRKYKRVVDEEGKNFC